MDTPLCVEAGSAAFFFFFQAVRFTSETPAGQVFTSESNEACKTFKLSMKRGAPSEKMMWFSILFGIHVIFMPSIFAIERNRRLASYPLRLWKTTRMGSCSRLSVGLCCKRCALPRGISLPSGSNPSPPLCSFGQPAATSRTNNLLGCFLSTCPPHSVVVACFLA